jgi:hypothetical protein
MNELDKTSFREAIVRSHDGAVANDPGQVKFDFGYAYSVSM